MYKLVVLALLAAMVAGVGASAATAKPRGLNGKIVLNSDNNVTGQEQVYTIDPDGSDTKLLMNDAESGQWSPDGTKIAIGGGVLNSDTGGFTDLQLATLYPDLFLGCGEWSPDGARLACEGGFVDPALQGVYTLRSSDGGDLQQVTSNPGGDDCPGDYSPNGKQLEFLRASDSVFALFTVKLDGTGLREITPNGMVLNFYCGSWSPQGNEIAFAAHVPADNRGTIWVVHTDGTGLHRIPIPSCGGVASLPDGSRNPDAAGCNYPSWSPDGQKILFSRQPGSEQSDDYIVNPDGSGLFQLTHTSDISEGGGDWGTHPVTP
jgi:Tol biopolymer transport system component